MAENKYALIRPAMTPPKVRHYRGLPAALDPESITQEFDPTAAVVLSEKDGGVYVDRLGRIGQEVGDTWHPDWQQAIEQVEYEFTDFVGEWQSVPDGKGDPIAYVQKQLRSHERG